jgi:DNA-binding GntR family transcriptional regulator
VPIDTPTFVAAPLPDFYVTPNRKALHEHLVRRADSEGRVLTTTVALGEELGLTTSVVQHTLGYLVQIGLATYVPGGRSRLAVITLASQEEVA